MHNCVFRHGLLFSICAAFVLQASARPVDFHEDVAGLIHNQQAVIIIDNVRIIDGTGVQAKEHASILIENGRIAAIEGAGDIDAAGAARINGEGGTILPGYVMMHEHLIYLDPVAPVASYTTEHLPMPPLYLAAGTTTLRTTGTMSARDDLQVRQLIREGRIAGPDLHITGPFLEGSGSFAYQMRPVLTAADARLFVRYWVNAGVTSFKAYMNVSREVLGAAIDEAHKLNATVTGHLCSVTFAEAAALGIDNLEHGLYVASDLAPDKLADECPQFPAADRIASMDTANPRVAELISLLVDNNVAITSTLPVFAAGVHPAIPTPASLELLSPRSRDMAESRWNDLREQRDPEKVQQMRQLLQREMDFERAFVNAGGTLLVGTDPTGWGGTLPPNSTHAALILLVEAGFSPLQVLNMATLEGARFLGVDQEVGSIEIGKKADLILIDGRPDEDIASVQNVALVFREGVAYDPAALIDSVQGSVGR